MSTTTPMTTTAQDPDPVDVVIVGYGPVGQLLTSLVAAGGASVTAVERWPQAYAKPRAVSFDSESRRILTRVGIGPDLEHIAEPSGEYLWTTAAGETLLDVPIADPGYCGWPDSTSMYQPGVEAALDREARRHGTAEVVRGETAVRLEQDEDEVRLITRSADGTERVRRAAYVVGCDGANSMVRDAMAAPDTAVADIDMGFSDDWLICDVRPHRPARPVPNNQQICDPARPTTAVSAGPGHRRFEFMRIPGEDRDDLNRTGTAWRLLEPHGFTPENCVLERHAVYTFRAYNAERWRDARLLLAGDAAHLMPPFAGQGMCSGFRDAANLAWKLGSVLAGRADPAILDSYESERREHVQHAIGMSVDLGRVVCQTDPKAAATRDTVMLASRRRGLAPPRPKTPVRPLKDGMLRPGARDGLVGELVPQFRVTGAGGTGWFDDMVGYGWLLVCLPEGRPRDRALLAEAGIRVVVVHAPGTVVPTGGSRDPVVEIVDEHYRALLSQAGHAAVLVRPDFYVFGGSGGGQDVDDLVADCAAGLHPHGTASRM